MKVIEKLNDTQYLARRESTMWNYRIIVTSEKNLEVGRSYSYFRDKIEKIKIESLCQVTAEMFYGEYFDNGDYDELKDACLSVLRGESTIEEEKEFFEID